MNQPIQPINEVRGLVVSLEQSVRPELLAGYHQIGGVRAYIVWSQCQTTGSIQPSLMNTAKEACKSLHWCTSDLCVPFALEAERGLRLVEGRAKKAENYLRHWTGLMKNAVPVQALADQGLTLGVEIARKAPTAPKAGSAIRPDLLKASTMVGASHVWTFALKGEKDVLQLNEILLLSTAWDRREEEGPEYWRFTLAAGSERSTPDSQLQLSFLGEPA